MTLKFRALQAIWVVFLSLAGWVEAEINQPHFGSSFDFGQIVKGREDLQLLQDFQPLFRQGVFMNTSGHHDNKFQVSLTLGGLFWYGLPPRNPSQTNQLYGWGVGEAQGIYKFGDPEEPSATLQLGIFGHKYNSDAQNLGEYLYRSGTYPAFLWTGGWSWVNSAGYLAQGLKLNLPTFEGKISHDFTLYVERDFAPKHDLSPGYLITAKPTSYFEVAAGIVWQSGLSFKPDSIISPRDLKNAAYFDSLAGKWLPVEVGGLSVVDTSGHDLRYYTYQGFKGMARASLDFSDLGLDGFKLYVEAALLGFKNYPYYYEKRSQRAPLMFGMHIPTFGFLDQLAFEVEYLNSPFANSINLTYDQQIPVPDVAEEFVPREGLWKQDSIATYYQNCVNDPTSHPECGGSDSASIWNALTDRYDAYTPSLHSEMEKDNWKWSVSAKRELIDGLNLTVQVASDHFRVYEYVFARVLPAPVTSRPSEWYWLLRLEFGI